MARSYNKAEVESARRGFQRQMREAQLQCDHKNNNGACLENVRTTNRYVQNRNKYSEATVICKECGEIFEMEPYTTEQLEDAFFIISSAVNQVKVFDDSNDDDYQKLVEMLAVIDDFRTGFMPYHNNMMKRLANKGGNRKGSSQRQKGKLGAGVNSSQFATR